jgi:hypothetical protein
MRIQVPVLFLVGLLSTATVFAQQEDEHAGHHPDQQAQEDSGSSGEKGGDSVQALARNMKKIQDLMKQIQAASGAAEKETLMGEHLRAMREQMRMVLAMGPGMAMKGGMGGEKPAAQDGPKGGGMMGGGMMMKMHKQMEGRMRMLELMLQQMLEREAVEAGVEHEQ